MIQQQQGWQVLAASKTITIHSSQSENVTPVDQYNPHRGIVNCAVYNHTGKVIASCGQDGKISLHSAQRCQDKLLQIVYYNASQQPSSINCCLFSPKSKFIGAGSVNSTVKIWDMKSNNKDKQPLYKLKGHTGAITSLGWVNGQQLIASSSTSGNIFLHDLSTGAIRQSLQSRLQQGINSIKVSEGEGYRRLGACTNSGSLMVWDLNVSAKKPIYTYQDPKKSPFTCLSISSYSPVLMVCSSTDSNFLFMDVNQRKVIKNVSTDEPLTSIAFNDDGQMLVAGGMNGGLMLYDLRKIQTPVYRLTGHDTPIKSVSFSQKQKDKQKLKLKQKQPGPFSRTTSNNVQNVDKQQKTKVLTPVLSSNKLIGQQEKSGNQRIRNLALAKKQQVPMKPAQQKPAPIAQTYIPQASQASKTVNSATNIGNIASSNVSNHGNHGGRVATSQIIYPSSQQISHPQIKLLQQKITGQMRDMQSRLNEKFQLLHLEVIRQMQLAVQKMSACFEKKNNSQKQLQMKIKILQEQNQNLKKRSF